MGALSLRADLHNHSCLSHCADLSMSPALMARTARARGIDILALTDHNASLNSLPFALACARQGVIPLFGMEMSSAEEVHLLAIFAAPREALAFGAVIHDLIPAFPWKSGAFGDQVVVDEDERVLELHETWLGASLDASLGDLAERARLAGALVIPAHVDRGQFSMHSQLGFLPAGPYDAVESMGPPPSRLTGGLSAVSGSDAHYPEHIGRRPFAVEVPEEPASGLRRALEVFADAATSAANALSADEASFGGYEELLADPRLDLYPSAEAKLFIETLREALRAGRVHPLFIRPSAERS